ncbi:unnamed protein product [Urochloa decumbens]|uniref:Laccase n=1 Tax=Urochloa decumbens TaxID=240449 RepID=A0ABC9AGP1_9POAL
MVNKTRNINKELQAMKSRQSFPMVIASFFFFVLSAMAVPAAAAVVEHTFVVSQVRMTHLCKETLVTVVNGQFPGPAIEVVEGDSVAVHVVNKSPHNITIHWHGVKQRLNCWADGVPMVTQCPIRPGQSFTYRFHVDGQEGTLWWHAHVSCLRASLHGALIIRPRHGDRSYPFPKPHKEVPIIIGDWWDMDLDQLDRNMMDGYFADSQTATTINGKLGDLYNCSGAVEDTYVLDMEPGRTYLLRLINAGLYSEYYLKIAGHKFTVVASDANYVNPYTTDIVAIAPGETMDALVVADAAPGRYYMVALAIQPPAPDHQLPFAITRGIVQYRSNVEKKEEESQPGDVIPVLPDMPDQHDNFTTFYFHGNLTSLHQPRSPPVPAFSDEHMFITLSLGSICRQGESCERSGSNESIIVATMNDIAFQPPTAVAASLLEAHYYHRNDMAAAAGVKLRTLPDTPLKVFNYTDSDFISWGPKEARLEPTERGVPVRRFRHGAVVDVVFQSTSVMQSGSNPMHLHGHDMFVLAQGVGDYDAARDVARYNLVDPQVKNTVLVPRLGWVAIRFVADNPGVWYMHCHFEYHMSMGMVAVFIVEDGSSPDTSLPPPPADYPKCDQAEQLADQQQKGQSLAQAKLANM